jgi:DNA repair protein RadC
MKYIKEGTRQLNITVLVHIILTVNERHYSFAEEGDL